MSTLALSRLAVMRCNVCPGFSIVQPYLSGPTRRPQLQHRERSRRRTQLAIRRQANRRLYRPYAAVRDGRRIRQPLKPPATARPSLGLRPRSRCPQMNLTYRDVPWEAHRDAHAIPWSLGMPARRVSVLATRHEKATTMDDAKLQTARAPLDAPELPEQFDPDFYREALLHIARLTAARLVRERSALADIERRAKIPLGASPPARWCDGEQLIAGRRKPGSWDSGLPDRRVK